MDGLDMWAGGQKIAAAIVVSTLMIHSTQADQPAFRVDTDIFVAENAKPLKQNITLFHQGVFYDYSVGDALAVMVIDPTLGRITLLDSQKQLKTVIDTQQLARLHAEACQEAAQSELASLLQAAEKVNLDMATGKINVGTAQFSYTSTLQQPPQAVMAQQYALFADWSARLNAYYPPYQLPYLRLALNQAISDRGMLPAELVRTSSLNGQTSQLRCRLHPVWQLNADDQQKIASARRMIEEFKEVAAKEYFAIPKIVASRGDSTNTKVGRKQ